MTFLSEFYYIFFAQLCFRYFNAGKKKNNNSIFHTESIVWFRHIICHNRASWKVCNDVVSRGNAWWTMSKNGHPCPCQNCSQWPSTEKTGTEEDLAESSLISPRWPSCWGAELEWNSHYRKVNKSACTTLNNNVSNRATTDMSTQCAFLEPISSHKFMLK